MRRTISLNGSWQYEAQATATLRPGGLIEEQTDGLPPPGTTTIPGHWEFGGLENFHGRVRYARVFTFDQHDDDASIWLIFRGVDYFARVWLNDQLVGEHAGYFQPFQFDVTALVQPGENRIVVDVTCPREEPGTLWPNRKLMIKGILSHWDARPGSWDLATGQDHNSGGIWNDVLLEVRPLAHLGMLRFVTQLTPSEAPPGWGFHDVELDPDAPLQAIVLADAEVVAPPGRYALRVTLGNEPHVTTSIQVEQPGQRHTVVIQVPQPHLWWTWDLGEPHLEACRVELLRNGVTVDERHTDVGLREVRFDAERGEWYVNRRRVFIRGTNVIPTLWLGQYDQARIAEDIRLLREAHINGARVCVHVNRESFYSACDRAGILVWQDFALQWGYEETPEFVHEAVRQIRDMVRLLYNHPSIALWCCQNESSFHNKYILDPVLAAAVAAEDGSRHIRPTSEFTEHTYGGWYGGHYRDYAALPATPVLTEFGAQALPDAESVRRMVGDSWPPDLARLSYHDFQPDQSANVAGVSMGASLEEFVANSQAYQSRLLKFAIERYRKAKYEQLGGMFQFMFMDCWPSITWSVVSYERLPKSGYYTLQQVYQPVLIGIDLYRETHFIGTDVNTLAFPLSVQPWVVNDRHEELTGCTFLVRLRGPGGVYAFGSEQQFSVPADAVLRHGPRLQCNLPAGLAVGAYTLELELHSGDEQLSSNSYLLNIVSTATNDT